LASRQHHDPGRDRQIGFARARGPEPQHQIVLEQGFEITRLVLGSWPDDAPRCRDADAVAVALLVAEVEAYRVVDIRAGDVVALFDVTIEIAQHLACMRPRVRRSRHRQTIAAVRNFDRQLALDLGQMLVVRSDQPREDGVVGELERDTGGLALILLAAPAQCATAPSNSPARLFVFVPVIRTRDSRPSNVSGARACTDCR